MTWSVHEGDCRVILPTLERAGLVLTDPPYGISLKTNYKSRKRTALATCNDFPPVHDDDKPFDPSHLLGLGRVILFGANHYADKLPPSATWLVWDKLGGLTSKRALGFNDQADCELAWSNLGGPARLLSHRWMGAMKASERTSRRVHPTQKPVALMARLIETFTQPGDLVIDPYCGAGSTGVAAVQTGRRFIGIEIEAAYCAIARKRIAEAAASLFAESAA
jgi:site-specific DNA-methyltransferase (adenine-specific)